MTENTEVTIDKEELKRYLYAELNEEEAENLENDFFLNDELFFEVVDLENELVEHYTRGRLEGAELARFEASLDKFPERQQKIANTRALHTYIEEERPPVAIVEAEPQKQTFWQTITDFFTIQSPLLGSAMAGLLVIFMVGAIMLFLDGRRKSEELARLQNERNGIEGVWQKRENELKDQLANSDQRLNELNNQLAGKESDTEDYIKTLNAETQKNQQLERELEKLRREKADPVTTPKNSGPIIASILLSPTSGDRGGNDPGKNKTAKVGEDTKKLAINLTLPDNLKKDEVYTIKLNEQPLMNNVSLNGKKSLNLTIPIKNLNAGPNKLTVTDSGDRDVTKYIFNVDKPKD